MNCVDVDHFDFVPRPVMTEFLQVMSIFISESPTIGGRRWGGGAGVGGWGDT